MIVSKTPLRVSFVGGGSDLKEYYRHGYGAVVSTAINKYVYVFVNRRIDRKLRVEYSRTELISSVDEVQHDLVREALRFSGLRCGLEVSYLGDIQVGQAGTGLGSSSALTVGLLNAFYAMKGECASAERLAREATHIEIDVLGRPIGPQDQYAAAFGGLNYLRFNADNRVEVVPILVKREAQLFANLLLFHTGLATESSAVLSEQRANTKRNKTILEEMVELTEDVKLALEAGRIEFLGSALHQNWIRKKQLATKISNTVIDGYYEKALHAGALGGKILGSGGGGFLLFYVEQKKQKSVRAALSDLLEVPFHMDNLGSHIAYRD